MEQKEEEIIIALSEKKCAALFLSKNWISKVKRWQGSDAFEESRGAFRINVRCSLAKAMMCFGKTAKPTNDQEEVELKKWGSNLLLELPIAMTTPTI